MRFYTAVCKTHGWQSPGLYKNAASASRSVGAHRAVTSEPHEVTIQLVEIEQKNMKIISETPMVIRKKT